MRFFIKHIGIFLSALIFCYSIKSIAQRDQSYSTEKFVIDSLEKQLKLTNSTNDIESINKVKILNALGDACLKANEYDKTIKHSRLALLILKKLSISKNLNLKREIGIEIAVSNNNIGTIFSKRGNYIPALDYFKLALKSAEGAASNTDITASLENMAFAYSRLSDYVKSLELYFRAMKVYENLNDKKGIAKSYYNIGGIFLTQNNFSKSIEENTKALKIRNELRTADSNDVENNTAIASIYNNLGNTYWALSDNETAMKYHYKALKIRQQLGNIEGVGGCYNNMGLTLASQKKYKEALEMHLKAREINENMGNTYRVMGNNMNIVNLYITEFPTLKVKDKNLLKQKTEKILKEALKTGYELHEKLLIQEALSNLSALYNLTGDYDDALTNYKLFVIYKDTLFNQELTKKTVQAEMKYEFNRKEATAKLEQEKKDALENEENKKQKIIRNSFIAAFVLMMILAGFIFRSYREKKKTHQIISAQKREVEWQKTLAEQKQLQIIDSINYAKRIQESILIPEEKIRKYLHDLFILYKPKDIVSGDFYWFSEIKKNEVILVAADCTGHGVPGAFLSMIASTLLNEIVNHNGINDPGEIISELALGISSTLANKDNEYRDGMDISVCKINLKERKLFFSGANQSVYLVNGNGLQKIDSKISSIYGILGIEKNEKIIVEEFEVKPGTMMYITTDGYSDQIGEKSKKKFLTSRFEKLMTEIRHFSIDGQKSKLVQSLEEWKGEMSQVDDVLVIGLRIT